MEWLTDPQIWISLLTLTALEIVLGIDNVIFISILAGKLPPEQQDKARKLGLTLALVTRVILLCSISWVIPASSVTALANATCAVQTGLFLTRFNVASTATIMFQRAVCFAFMRFDFLR